MKKKSISIFITILLMLAVIAATVYAINKNDPDTDIPVETPAQTERIPVETSLQTETMPIETSLQTETMPVETSLQTETMPVETSLQTETMPVETPLQTEPSRDRIDGTYYCHSNGLYFPGKTYDEKWHTEHPDYVPAITFNQDGTFIFRIHYGAGMADVGGVYSIEDNTILLDCKLEGSFFEGLDDQGLPYMDGRYILEIVDYDHLTFDVVPDAIFKSGCYGIRPGDSFIRK